MSKNIDHTEGQVRTHASIHPIYASESAWGAIMITLLEKAKGILHKGGFTFVAINGEKEFVSSLLGIAPLLSILKNTPDMLDGAAVADKVIGKAAAMLMAYGNVSEVYAGVVSEHALPVFERAGITLLYDKVVPHIRNRAGTGMCPMEKKVLLMDDPVGCFRILSE